MNIREYHDDRTRLSKSTLDIIRRSPYEFYCRRVNPDAVPAHIRLQWAKDDDKRDFAVGDALDRLLLEPHKFQQDFVVTTEKPRNTRDGRDAHLSILKENQGKRWLSVDELQLVKDMKDAIEASPLHAYVNPSESQNTFFFEVEGVPMKCRPDWLQPMADGVIWIFDLKTIDSILKWQRHVMDFRYHVQAALYLDGVAQNVENIGGFAFMVVEKEWPFRVHVRLLPADVIAIGRQEYMEDIATYKACMETGIWPKGGDDWETTEMPGWWMNLKRNI